MIDTRYELAIARIEGIRDEQLVGEPFLDYFRKGASFLLLLDLVTKKVIGDELSGMDTLSLEQLNRNLYEDILPENYDHSMANPRYMSRLFKDAGYDDTLAKYLCFVLTEMRGLIPYAFEGNKEVLVTYMELFLEVYGEFAMAYEEDSVPNSEELRQCIYWFERDNCEMMTDLRIKDTLDPKRDFATRIIMDSDLTDLRYLYRFGEYITDNEIKCAQYINSLTEEEIESMASTFTEGYRIGFVNTGKDISIKKTVNIRYTLGFERIVRKSIERLDNGQHPFYEK